jgi:hypothetical protein
MTLDYLHRDRLCVCKGDVRIRLNLELQSLTKNTLQLHLASFAIILAQKSPAQTGRGYRSNSDQYRWNASLPIAFQSCIPPTRDAEWRPWYHPKGAPGPLDDTQAVKHQPRLRERRPPFFSLELLAHVIRLHSSCLDRRDLHLDRVQRALLSGQLDAARRQQHAIASQRSPPPGCTLGAGASTAPCTGVITLKAAFGQLISVVVLPLIFGATKANISSCSLEALETQGEPVAIWSILVAFRQVDHFAVQPL